MTNADSPAKATADQAGNTAADSASSNGLEKLPERVRVHALAKLLGSSSREVLGKLGELGETARSPQSSVPRATALRVAEMFGVPGTGDEQSSSAATASAVASESTAATGEAPAADTSARGSTTSVGNTVADKTAEPARSTAATTPESGGEPTGQPGAGEADGNNRAASAPLSAAPSPVFLPPEPTAPAAPQQEQSSPPATVDDPQDAQQRGQQRAEHQAARPSTQRGASTAGGAARDGGGDATASTAGTTGTDNTATSGSSGGAAAEGTSSDSDGDGARKRRRRGRRGRGRGRGTDSAGHHEMDTTHAAEDTTQQDRADSQAGSQPAQSGGRRHDDSAGQQDPASKSNGAQRQQHESAADEPSSETTQRAAAAGEDDSTSSGAGEGGENRRRRRRRRRKSSANGESSAGDDPPNTVTHVRESAPQEQATDTDEVRSVRGSTRLEAKRQRRRDGRDAGRRRAPVLSEAEFLARRESVERTMVVADKAGATQLGVLEDGVLVEHFVTSSGAGSIVGNVYLGRVQNVLPSMEAAFVDIGKGRNAVLYAGEVDWDSAGLEGKARKIEQALSSGDHVLVQVTKDPLGHKGARLTTQISLPGRFLVYVPSGATTGISRKLAENERRRLKDILKRVVPEDAGVIIRTASEGIGEQELERDVQRLRSEWDSIKQRSETAANAPGGSGAGSTTQSKKSQAPALLYEEPDMLIKVVRDLFTADFGKMEIQGDYAWQTLHGYVEKVAPELTDRLKRYVGTGDVFVDYRIDEQITKALDRKVWLPSGGYLVIDRTEAMTVIDVNTGKFTGSGGNLEETVTRNNLESAEEIVRQLRLRDIGGIIVIDFIDMVLESNRELVLRRLTECLARDRTRHQVAEVTSLGLVQMTRKRLGSGLLESFSTTCEHCSGRGLHISTQPHKHTNGSESGSRKRGKGKRGNSDSGSSSGGASAGPTQQQRESAASAVAMVANASKYAQEKSSEQAETRAQQQDAAATVDSDDAAATDTTSAAVADTDAAVPSSQRSAAQSAAQSATTATSASESGRTGTERSAARRGRRAASRPAGPPV